MSADIKELRGVVLNVDYISADGERQGSYRFSVDLEDDGDGNLSLDVRRVDGRARDDVWMLHLPDVEEALRVLKRWQS